MNLFSAGLVTWSHLQGPPDFEEKEDKNNDQKRISLKIIKKWPRQNQNHNSDAAW